MESKFAGFAHKFDKKVKVKYLLHEQDSVKQGQVYEKYLVENEQDIQNLRDSKIIGVLHLQGIRKILNEGDKVIVNQSGSYCGMEGTWQLAE